ncbi:MAG: endonuclease/exonuclease/phosphatase family protein [Pseudomonas sp.]
MLGVALFGLSLLLLTATLVAKLRLHHWWIRVWEFPRMQLASLALASCLISAFVEGPWQLPSLLVSLLVLGVQGWYILPWTPLYPVQVKAAKADSSDDRCITLLIANVLTPNRNADGLISQIKTLQPDVILTLESDDWWQTQLDTALEADWPHSVKVPQDNLYGMHLYSRLQLQDAEVKRLIQDDIPSIHGWLLLDSRHRVRFHALHPRPPAPQESDKSLWRDAELLLVGKEVHERDVPTLVFGDLNDVAWSRTTRLFCRVSGMLDPRRGRGLFSTFHADYRLLRWPLDHIFSSAHFTLGGMQRLERFGSDHFPILATLCYRPSRADEHDTPERDPGDRQEARETINEAKTQA